MATGAFTWDLQVEDGSSPPSPLMIPNAQDPPSTSQSVLFVPPASLTGHWTGHIIGKDDTHTITLALSSTGSDFGGMGSVITAAIPVRLIGLPPNS